MSQLGWIDFSSTDRERVSQVLAILKEKGTLDELGVGQIRDAFADLLFPGISTIQTRAKYFIIIPRIFRDYQELPQREQSRTSLSRHLNQMEDRVAEILVEKHGSAEVGIIGSESIDKGGVERRPSSVYWNGLRIFNLIHTRSSLNEFVQSGMNNTVNIKTTTQQALTEEDDRDAQYLDSLIHLDRYLPEWMDQLTIHLTEAESKFLVEKIRHSTFIKDSALSQILANNCLEESLSSEFIEFSALAKWLSNNPGISITCAERLEMASEFSLAIEGAHIRYNILIARSINNATAEKRYEEEFKDWLELVRALNIFREEAHSDWLNSAGASKRRFKTLTTGFIRRWSEAIRAGKSTQYLDNIVMKQAKANKPGRSLLLKKLSDDTGWVGMRKLDYRWNTVRVILKDIQKGLAC